MDVWLSRNTLGLAGGHQATTEVEGQAGRGLTVHSAVQYALESTLRLHKDSHGWRFGRICGESVNAEDKSFLPCTQHGGFAAPPMKRENLFPHSLGLT
jgi:hypothetical protein